MFLLLLLLPPPLPMLLLTPPLPSPPLPCRRPLRGASRRSHTASQSRSRRRTKRTTRTRRRKRRKWRKFQARHHTRAPPRASLCAPVHGDKNKSISNIIKRRSRVLRRRTRQAALDKPRVHDGQWGFSLLKLESPKRLRIVPSKRSNPEFFYRKTQKHCALRKTPNCVMFIKRVCRT